MKKLTLTIARTPILGRTIFIIFRAKIAFRYFYTPLYHLLKWLFISKETTNFTYELTDQNKRYLASTIANILNIEISQVELYITEIEENEEIKQHIATITDASELSYKADKTIRLGKRIGWYAFARALKPKIIIETGIDKGLGSCVLTAALIKNKEEGFEGQYYGTDINPNAGYLLSGKYAKLGSIIYGDSIQSLKNFEGTVDLFINDSDHSDKYEAEEYKTIANKLSSNAILLGDNAHCTDKLFEFSLRNNRNFIFFQENPKNHWYPGGGIGISFKRRSSSDLIVQLPVK